MYQLQQVLNIMDLFTSKPKINFYSSLFSNLDLSHIPEFPSSKFRPIGYSRHANLIIAHLCGFDITKKLPSYWTFERLLKNFDHKYLSLIMQNQVKILKNLGVICKAIFFGFYFY